MTSVAVNGLEPSLPEPLGDEQGGKAATSAQASSAKGKMDQEAAVTGAGSKGVPQTKGAGFGPMYNFMRFVGERSVAHFFKRCIVVGGHDVPAKGPFILCCTHFSTLMDVAIISADLPHRRPIHYWAKKGLYKRQPFRWILENSGNIQVDRKEKNNAALFAGTFDAMKAGEAIGLFPEGGSFTEHRLHGMKAGAAWAALEYAKHLASLGEDVPEAARVPVLIVPAAINYTDKSRFRSEVVFEFGKAFTVDEYADEFLQRPSSSFVEPSPALQSLLKSSGLDKKIKEGQSGDTLDVPSLRKTLGIETGASSNDEEGRSTSARAASSLTMAAQRASKAPSDSAAARSAVKKLTDRIGAEIYKMTIDAPDWTTWHSIKMARELIWPKNGTVPLKELVPVSNALVAILNAPLPEARAANETLCALQGILLASSTDVFTLNAMARRIPVSRRTVHALMKDGSSADEPFKVPSRRHARAALPSYVGALGYFVRSLGAFVIRLPYLIPLLIVYGPAYFIGWALSLRYASHEEESMASAKSLCAFVIGGLTHLLLIATVAACLLFTPPGWLLGVALSYAVERLHVYLLDESYVCFKNLAASWRVLLATASGALTPVLPNSIANRSVVQLGGEDVAVQMAVDIVKTHPGVQWSFIKALRSARAQRDPRRQERFTKQPNRPQSLRRLVERPPCFRVMAVSRAIHARAQYSLDVLLNEMERISQSALAGDVDAPALSMATLESYRYLRAQMDATEAHLTAPR